MTRDPLLDATAFVTGGAQGIGLGIAQALARRGVSLVLADVDEAKLEKACRSLNEVTPTIGFRLDVRDRDRFRQVADEAEAVLGPVSLLFNNAGVAGGAPFEVEDHATWDFFIDVNVKGVVNGLQTFLPRMIARGGGGYVVNTASGAGLAGLSSPLYSLTKFAVVGLSESLRNEVEPCGIGVSVLCPGPVATTILRNTADQQRKNAPATSILPDDAIEETEATLALGVAPADVGEMVIDAMREDRLYIHTDEVMAEHVRARTEAILAAMPSALARRVTETNGTPAPARG